MGAGSVEADLTALVGAPDVRADEDVRQREAWLSAVVEQSHDLVAIYDSSGHFVFVSPSHERVLGWTPAELIGTRTVDLLHPDERGDVVQAFTVQFLDPKMQGPIEHRIRCKDGSWRWVEAVAVDLQTDAAIGALVTARDVTERREAEVLRAEQARVLEQIARGAPLAQTLAMVTDMLERHIADAVGGIGLVTPDRVFQVVCAPHLSHQARAAIDGHPVDAQIDDFHTDFVVDRVASVLRGTSAEALHADGLETIWASRMRSSEGGTHIGGVTVFFPEHRLPTDNERALLVVASSIAGIAIERDRAQSRLTHQATHDALTGLPNRDALLERLGEVGRCARRNRSGSVLLFLDIDRFKVLNDSVGHGAGDRLLVEMAARLQAALRPGDLVARFGGDEFVMVCDGIEDPAASYELASRVLDVVRRPFLVEGTELVVTASIGIAEVDERPASEVVRDADTAMYRAKERGRARAELFDERLRDRVVERLETERLLREATDNGTFVMHYQPIVAIGTGAFIGVEALLRWPHPTRGLLLPAEFLSVAGEAGLMPAIGAWVRDEVCRQAASWSEQDPDWRDFRIGMNLSAAELVDPQLGANIERTIRKWAVDPSRLIFEITEHLLIDAAAARVLFAQLRGLGVALVLDDFGTGYSPLQQLREFPVQGIKIDRSFVAGIGLDPCDDAIVSAMVDLAGKLGLTCVAEGVETIEQDRQLLEMGCAFAQGYLYGPALPADQAERHLAS